jgi:phage baseplate assembly protein W
MKNLGEETYIGGRLPSQDSLNTVSQRVSTKTIGMKYPLTEPVNRGYFSQAPNQEAAKSALYQLLRTEPGERLFLPDFGCSLNSLLFDPYDDDLLEDIRDRLVTSVATYLPTVKILRLRVTPINNNAIPTILVSLWCQIRGEVNSNFEVSVTI